MANTSITPIRISVYGCHKNDVSIEEALLLLLLVNKVDIYRTAALLKSRGFLIESPPDLTGRTVYQLTGNGIEKIDQIVADSEYGSVNNVQEKDKELEKLAKGLKEIFPQGRKPGTNQYWADGIPLIKKRLILFFKKYGNNYSNEQILNAAQRYVNSFNGIYTYMRVLKYFILKEGKNAAGDVESTSELVTLLEQTEEGDDNISQDWTSNII